MSFEIKDIGPCKKRAEFQLDIKDVQEGFDKVYEEICENVAFPGFRKGKVPKQMVVKKYGKDVVGEVKEKLVHKTFYDMVEDKKLEIISQPSFDEKGSELKEGEGFSYSVSFEVRPEFELPKYQGIALEKKVRTVEDADIQKTQDNLLKSHARPEQDEAAGFEENGYALLSLQAVDEGGEVVHHNHSTFLPYNGDRLDIFQVEKLDALLKGKKKGDKVEVAFSAPAEFPAKPELAGKKLTLRLEVESVYRMKVPEFNADFVKALGFETEEQYRDTLRKMLEREYERKSHEEMKDQIYQFLDEQLKIEMPEDTVNRHVEYLASMKQYEMLRAGTPKEEVDAKKAELEGEMQKSARREIKVGFALNKIAEQEKVFATEREINNRIVQIANQRQMAPEKLRAELDKNHEIPAIRSQIREEKTIDLLIKKAEVKDVPAGDAK